MEEEEEKEEEEEDAAAAAAAEERYSSSRESSMIISFRILFSVTTLYGVRASILYFLYEIPESRVKIACE